MQYEFTEEQKELIVALATSEKFKVEEKIEKIQKKEDMKTSQFLGIYQHRLTEINKIIRIMEGVK